jgi:hypothetical protein
MKNRESGKTIGFLETRDGENHFSFFYYLIREHSKHRQKTDRLEKIGKGERKQLKTLKAIYQYINKAQPETDQVEL